MTSGKAWTVFSAFTGVIAIALTSYIFVYTQKQTKMELVATVLSKSNLIDADFKNRDKRIGLTYDGAEIDNLTIINLQIRNTGGQSIRGADVEQPITIHLADVKEIVSAHQVSAFPLDLNVKATASGSTVELEKTLLNPEDWFVISIHAIPDKLAGTSNVEKIGGRIAGLRKIEFHSEASQQGPQRPSWNILWGILATAIGALISLLTAMSKRYVSRLEVIEATYGTLNKTIDVTNSLRELVGKTRRNTLIVVASNAIGGDPVPGIRKMLKVRYKFLGRDHEQVFAENSLVQLP